jgi:flagellar basal-body rod modification protein FlgD
MSYTISKDATYVPTTTTGNGTTNSTVADAKSLSTNYTTFLNLLTAQVKNQDPLSPMDTTQWTNQLVQYSSVEQQLKGNQYLAQIAAGQSAGGMDSAVSYIGKTVVADNAFSALKDGKADWQYALGATAAKATLSVLDSSGKTVWSGAADDLTKGVHAFSWDGKDSAGQPLPDGYYQLKIAAKTANDTDIDSAVSLKGVVTSAENDGGTVYVKIGNTEVPLSSIIQVSATDDQSSADDALAAMLGNTAS